MVTYAVYDKKQVHIGFSNVVYGAGSAPRTD